MMQKNNDEMLEILNFANLVVASAKSSKDSEVKSAVGTLENAGMNLHGAVTGHNLSELEIIIPKEVLDEVIKEIPDSSVESPAVEEIVSSLTKIKPDILAGLLGVQPNNRSNPLPLHHKNKKSIGR